MGDPRQTKARSAKWRAHSEPIDTAFINNILIHRQIVHETGMGRVSRCYLERLMDEHPQVDVLRIYANSRTYWTKGALPCLL